MTTTQIGKSVPRLEGHAKVTGRAEYVHNLVLPGMLHGKIFRASVAHGRIRRIDTSAARAVAGVHSVVTGEDIRRLIPQPYYGPAFHDQPILALEKVRHAGEPVAVVLAADPHVAEEAARLIVADYEELPAVFDEVEAMTSKAVVHEVLRPAGTFPDLKHLEGAGTPTSRSTSTCGAATCERGFAEADHVFEHGFRTQQVLHVPLEPFVSVAEPAGDSLTLHTSSQTPSFVRIEIARLLGWPESRVRVRVPHLGGGFGAKVYVKLEALVTALALLTRRPVKIALTMEEQFYTITKHATTLRIKSGVTKDGRITARECEVWWNGGAYADIGPRSHAEIRIHRARPLRHREREDRFLRALHESSAGGSAARFRHSAARVGLRVPHRHDRAQPRNGPAGVPRAEHTARRPAAGHRHRDARRRHRQGARAARRRAWIWGRPFDRGTGTLRRGRGIAIGFKASISPTTSVAIVNVYADGSASLYCSTVDMGQGSDTALAQIAAEVLGFRPNRSASCTRTPT